MIYPPFEYLIQNSFYVPLTPEGQKQYDELWQRYLQAAPISP